MRLILQPKSTKKAATPYKDVTERLLGFRFLILFRIYAIVSLFALAVSKKLAFTLFISFSIVALNRKVSGHVAPVHGLSRFNELYNRLVSVRFARSLLSYLVSAIVYFVLVARPAGNLYTVEMVAGIPNNARGLGKAVSKGLISHSIVYLNENIVFNVFAALVVASGYAVYEAVVDQTRLVFSSIGLSPRDALLKDYRRFGAQTLGLCQGVFALQIIYWMVRPIFLIPFYAGPFGGYYVAGTTSLSKFCGFILYPIQWSFLVVVWQFGTKAFNAYYCRGPVHHGKTISQGSSDPNATLLTGINAPRTTIANLEAWLELRVIATSMKERRVQIYSDAGSEKPIWKLIYQSFDQYIAAVTTDLDNLLPKKAVVQLEEKPTKLASHDPRTIKISDKHVLADRPSAVDQLVFKLQSEAETVEVWDPLKRRIGGKAQKIKEYMLKTRYASIFELTIGRQVEQQLLDEDVLQAAIVAVAELMVNSYNEDTMGYVQTDIGSALGRYDALLTLISSLRRELGIEVLVSESLDKLETSLHTAFDAVCTRFKPHFGSLDISDSVKTRANYL